MAIDPKKFKKLQQNLDEFVEVAPIKDESSKELMKMLLGDAMDEMEDLISESRPPRLYIFGRSGAGKSSLINALSNQEVADVGTYEPTTEKSEMYHIEFPEYYASWDVVDSRGLFESVSPDGDEAADTVEILKEDLKKYRPDILLHVLTPDHVRAGKDDFEAIEYLQDELGDLFPPVVYCLNKVDTHMAPTGDWPPEENSSLAGDIKMNLDFVSEVLHAQDDSSFENEPLKENRPLYGYLFDSEKHVGVVPLCLTEDPYWNIETLSWLIADFLPESATLQFAQLQQREGIMKNLSQDVRNRFAMVATGVGAYPAPVADVAVLLPLQYLLVVIVGGLSCRELSLATGKEYLSAVGTTTIAGLAARGMARSLIQLVPGVGTAISAGVAGGTTWAIGRSAEAYFFDDDDESKPSDWKKEGVEQIRKKIDGKSPKKH